MVFGIGNQIVETGVVNNKKDVKGDGEHEKSLGNSSDGSSVDI